MKIYFPIFILLLNAAFFSPIKAQAYSVLTHEAIIDVCWDSAIQPLLLKKFPASTPNQLEEAHAYAYGGAVAPDMGYYPFGSKLFTNLVHYVRSGDFVEALFAEATDINEYAFAIGAACHYYADKYGHPIGTNVCVSMIYDKTKSKYGSPVNYEQDPIAHIRTEFGFDVLQTARGNYASEKYHAFIGFKVSEPVLKRAFLKTYGLKIEDVFKDFPLAVSTFRWVVKNFFPTITRTAWASKKQDIVKAHPGITRRKFEYKMRNANYYHEFGKRREKPGFFAGTLAVVVYILPKVGPLKSLKIKVPGTEAEKVFIRSFDTVQVHFASFLSKTQHTRINLQNIDYDTGGMTAAGEYNLADETYMDLVIKLKETSFSNVSISLKNNIINFYGGCNEEQAAKAGSAKWQTISAAMDTLALLNP